MRLEAGLHLAIASAQQRDRALEAMHPLWGGSLCLADYQERTADAMRSPWGQDHYSFYVVLGPGGEIQASCKAYDLPMWALGRPVRTLGLGAVFTLPDYRNRGIASRMIRALLDGYAERGFRLATLFSDIDPAFYEKLGFRRLASRRYLGTIAHMPPPTPGASWRSPTPDDFKTMMALHEATARTFSLAYGRTADLWPFQLARAEARTALLQHDGAIVGYASYAVERGALVIHDWGAAHAADALAVVRTAPELAPGATTMSGWFPDGAPAADLPFEVEERERAVWMAAPLGDDPPPISALVSGPHHAWLVDHF